jgi:hypothetical protein
MALCKGTEDFQASSTRSTKHLGFRKLHPPSQALSLFGAPDPNVYHLL